MSFQSLKEQEEERCSHKASTFMYHPSMKEHDRSIRSQLWVPFLDEFTFSSNEDDFDELLVQGLVTKGNFIKALKGCQKRLFFSTSIRDPRPDFDFDKPVRVAGRAWQSDVVYTSSFEKHRISKKVNKRGGEYVMFDSYHIKRTGGRHVKVKEWFVGKVLFFFQYNFKHADTPAGSFYALIETAKSHTTANHDPTIPVVTLFEANENAKLVVVDVANIVSLLALIAVVTRHGPRSMSQKTTTYYCIAPSTCFDINLQNSAGKLRNIC
ncbi:unnamed protein product [Mucor hiemalis]